MTNHNSLRNIGFSVGLGLAAGSLGAVAAEQAPSQASVSGQAISIQDALNSHNHVANNVTVDQGFELPLPHKSADSLVGVISPIDLGHNYYAYVSSSLENGHITLQTVKYAGHLSASRGLRYAYNKNYFHKVTEPIAVVYDEISNPGGSTERTYTVTAGTVSGNVNKLIQTVPGVSPTEQRSEYSEQLGQIYGNQIAQPLYEGK